MIEFQIAPHAVGAGLKLPQGRQGPHGRRDSRGRSALRGMVRNVQGSQYFRHSVAKGCT